MKYTKKRKINTLFGLIPLLVLLFSIVGGVTYAVVTGTRANTEHGFQVNVRGAVKVSATIKGTSYLNATAIDTFTTTVEGETVTGIKDFATPLSIEKAEDKISFLFEITNTTSEAKYTDLIIEPSYTLLESDNVVSTMYYSLDNTTYEVLADKYLVVHKEGKVYVKLVIEITEINNVYTDPNGKINFNLYTEDGLPTDFEYDAEYSIVDGVAYEKVLCPTCGAIHKETTAMKQDTYVIVSADEDDDNYAQKVLDTNINGKTIIFSEGEYGDLIIRPSKETVEAIYEYDQENPLVKGAEVALKDVDTTKATKGYHYVRSLKNITFVGTDGAVFKGVFVVESGNVGAGEGKGAGNEEQHAIYTDKNRLGLTDIRMDVIRNLTMESTNSTYGHTDICYSAHMPIDGLTFDNMNFSGKYGRIYIYEGRIDNEQKNITIKNCDFITTEAYKSGHQYYNMAAPAISIYVKNTSFFENVVIKNNIIDGHYQGAVVLNGKNVSMEGNTISNTEHNALALHGASVIDSYITGTYTTGKIVFKNNTINTIGVGIATGERAIRFADIKDGQVVIENNNFKNCIEDRTASGEGYQLLKSGTITNSFLKMYGNTYDDEPMNDTTIKNETFIIYMQ